MNKPVTILGAGNSGLAMAAHLADNGHPVCLWNRSPEPLDSLSSSEQTIHIEGVVSGKVRIELVTVSIEEALRFSNTVMVTTPADAHSNIASLTAPYIGSDHSVVLNPGRCFGVIDFINELKKRGCSSLPLISETQTILYTCRKLDFNRSLILALKKKVLISSTNRERTSEAVSLLPDCIRHYFTPANSLLETSLGNIGMILHCLPVLMNVGWIENKKTSFKYYYDGITPSIASLLTKMDEERLKVASWFGEDLPSLSQWLETTYGAAGDTLFEKIQSVESYRTIEALDTLQHRYLLEDIPFGLVPLEDVGLTLGLPMKLTTMTIELANEIFGYDFRLKGRTLKSLGLSIESLKKMAEE